VGSKLSGGVKVSRVEGRGGRRVEKVEWRGEGAEGVK
jgi:hypothetical protein